MSLIDFEKGKREDNPLLDAAKVVPNKVIIYELSRLINEHSNTSIPKQNIDLTSVRDIVKLLRDNDYIDSSKESNIVSFYEKVTKQKKERCATH